MDLIRLSLSILNSLKLFVFQTAHFSPLFFLPPLPGSAFCLQEFERRFGSVLSMTSLLVRQRQQSNQPVDYILLFKQFTMSLLRLTQLLSSWWAQQQQQQQLQFPWHHFEIQNSIPIDWDDDEKNWKLLHNYKSRLQRLSSLRVFCYYGLKKWDNDNILMTTGAVIRERKQEKLFRIVDWVTGAHTLTPLVALS